VSFVPGVIGIIFNMLVFTRPTLRREACTNYFFAATCVDSFIVFVVLPTRIVSNGFGLDPGNLNRVICKLENFSFNAARSTSCWLIAMTCFDRFLHSSANVRIRRLSSLKTARVIIGSTVIGIFGAYCHYLIFYDIYTYNRYGSAVSSSYCSSINTAYNNFVGIFHMTFYSLCPSFLMLLFGSLTVINVRQRRRVLTIVNENNRVSRRTDSQLLCMLAVQVFVIIISTLPFSVTRLYILFTRNTINSVVSGVVSTIPYFAHTSSFYLYTLTGTIFRQELFKIISYCLPHNQNLVHIHHVTTNQIPALQNNRQKSGMQK
jgi:hypothetical protein